MKKLLFAVSALAALSLLAPSTGLAQAQNILGFYADEAATENNIVGAAAYSTNSVYVVVTNPYNLIRDNDITFLGGIEFGYGVTGATVLSISFPVAFTDVGGAPGNHIVGFGEPVAVVDGMATVATLSVLYTSATGTDPCFFTLNPANPASEAGYMACLDTANPGDICILTPPYESFDYNVFAINDVVAVEETTMDNVKAMYR